MVTCTELYLDTLGGLDLDGSTDKNLLYFIVENLATLDPCLTPFIQSLLDGRRLYNTLR